MAAAGCWSLSSEICRVVSALCHCAPRHLLAVKSPAPSDSEALAGHMSRGAPVSAERAGLCGSVAATLPDLREAHPSVAGHIIPMWSNADHRPEFSMWSHPVSCLWGRLGGGNGRPTPIPRRLPGLGATSLHAAMPMFGPPQDWGPMAMMPMPLRMSHPNVLPGSAVRAAPLNEQAREASSEGNSNSDNCDLSTN